MFTEEMTATLEAAIVEYVVTKVPTFNLAEHAETSFSRLGLDSLGHVELTAVIEKTLALELEPDLAFNYPTVTALIKHLGENFAQEVADADA